MTVPSGDKGQSGIYLCAFEYVHLLNADSVSCMLPPSFATEHKLTSAFVVCFAEKVLLDLGPLSLPSENHLPGFLWIPQ
jgi:hypothetical protein